MRSLPRPCTHRHRPRVECANRRVLRAPTGRQTLPPILLRREACVKLVMCENRGTLLFPRRKIPHRLGSSELEHCAGGPTNSAMQVTGRCVDSAPERIQTVQQSPGTQGTAAHLHQCFLTLVRCGCCGIGGCIHGYSLILHRCGRPRSCRGASGRFACRKSIGAGAGMPRLPRARPEAHHRKGEEE